MTTHDRPVPVTHDEARASLCPPMAGGHEPPVDIATLRRYIDEQQAHDAAREPLERRAEEAERERDEAMATIDEWKVASGIVAGEEMGDPDGVTPAAAQAFWEGVERERDEWKARADRAESTIANWGTDSAQVALRRLRDAIGTEGTGSHDEVVTEAIRIAGHCARATERAEKAEAALAAATARAEAEERERIATAEACAMYAERRAAADERADRAEAALAAARPWIKLGDSIPPIGLAVEVSRTGFDSCLAAWHPIDGGAWRSTKTGGEVASRPSDRWRRVVEQDGAADKLAAAEISSLAARGWGWERRRALYERIAPSFPETLHAASSLAIYIVQSECVAVVKGIESAVTDAMVAELERLEARAGEGCEG